MLKLESFSIIEASADGGDARKEGLTLTDVVQSRDKVLGRDDPRFSRVELRRPPGVSSGARSMAVAPPPRRQKLGTVVNRQR